MSGGNGEVRMGEDVDRGHRKWGGVNGVLSKPLGIANGEEENGGENE